MSLNPFNEVIWSTLIVLVIKGIQLTVYRYISWIIQINSKKLNSLIDLIVWRQCSEANYLKLVSIFNNSINSINAILLNYLSLSTAAPYIQISDATTIPHIKGGRYRDF